MWSWSKAHLFFLPHLEWKHMSANNPKTTLCRHIDQYVGRYIKRYIGRGVHKIHMIRSISNNIIQINHSKRTISYFICQVKSWPTVIDQIECIYIWAVQFHFLGSVKFMLENPHNVNIFSTTCTHKSILYQVLFQIFIAGTFTFLHLCNL